MIYEAIDLWSYPSLEHHGIKGMKWGVRKDRGPHKTRKQKRLERSDYGKAKNMSDQELQRTINRINLEQNYISAVQRDRAAYKEATSSVLSRWGRKTINSIFRTGKDVKNTGEKMARNAAINAYLYEFPIAKKPKL